MKRGIVRTFAWLPLLAVGAADLGSSARRTVCSSRKARSPTAVRRDN